MCLQILIQNGVDIFTLYNSEPLLKNTINIYQGKFIAGWRPVGGLILTNMKILIIASILYSKNYLTQLDFSSKQIRVFRF